MARLQLECALGFSRDRKRSHERRSYRQNGKWYLVNTGPTYANIYLVTEYSDAELKVLESIEDKTGNQQASDSTTPPVPKQ